MRLTGCTSLITSPVPVQTDGRVLMLGVTVWSCGCGVRYKAISETAFIPENKVAVTCPRCETVTQILGTPETILEEAIDSKWRLVRKTVSVGA
jgi:hypothetical protein